MLQPRAAAAAAVVGDRIIVTGGVGANGALLNTTEIFDGNSWTLGAPIPTPRQMLATASDGKLVYTVGGTNGKSDRRLSRRTTRPRKPGRRGPTFRNHAVTSGWQSPIGVWSLSAGCQQGKSSRVWRYSIW